MTKKSSGWQGVLSNLLLVIPSVLNIATHFVACLESEFSQAKRGLLQLFALTLVALTLLAGAWFCLCAMLFLWLLNTFTVVSVFGLMLGGHLILLLMVAMWMTIVKNDVSFRRTRDLFRKK